MSISITKIEKKAQISLYESVKYQLIHELIFKRNEQITTLDLSILIFIHLYLTICQGYYLIETYIVLYRIDICKHLQGIASLQLYTILIREA